MSATPKKLVRWALDISLSGFGSPFSEGTSTESSSASSLQYINSQLIAHGFSHSPGLSLDGLAKDDADKVVKCLLGMLSQRVDDLSRTEDLTAKMRTLSYDHERLMSMYQAATERAANAEREMNVHKSRLATVKRTLQSTESAHKHTTAELQRTRTTLQALRNTHQAEIKKLEKEKERMAERWNKVSDAQVKLGTAGSGMRCANAAVVEAPDVQLRGKGQGFLDLALEQAEQARKELFDQNRKLRGLIVSAANDIQNVLHIAYADSGEEPAPLTLATLFPLSPTEAARDKLSSLLSSIRESVTRLSNSTTGPSPPPTSSSAPSGCSSKPHDTTQVDRLQAVIDTLRTELEEAQRQASTYAAQTQALFDRFAEDERVHGDIGEMSVDLMTVPARDEERQSLDERFKELEDERKKFTEAAVRLGREKAALEAERIKFLEEKRSWHVELMLADLPPTPGPLSEVPNASREQERASRSPPRKSPRKSSQRVKPVGIVVGKSSVKKTRVSRRSSGIGIVPTSPRKVTPAFETEVIPPPLQIPAFKTSIALPPPQPHVLPPAFTLPPPSPAASLPGTSSFSSTLIPPPPQVEQIPPAQSAPSIVVSMSDSGLDVPSQSSSIIAVSKSAPEVTSGTLSVPVPSTPVVHRPFPMAKPLAAAHMVHAYSPVKPSPLSRILMLSNSPDSPDIDRPRLDALQEDDEEDSDVSPTPAPPMNASTVPPIRSLAAELGLMEDDDNPLQEKKMQANVVKSRKTQPVTRPASKEKEKGRAEEQAPPRTRPAIALEKENVKRAKLSMAASSTTTAEKAPTVGKAGPKPLGRPKVAGKPPARKGGARRVPIGSAEAAPVGPGWKG